MQAAKIAKPKTTAVQLTPEFALLGEVLEFASADEIRDQGCQLIRASLERPEAIEVDLGGVNRANTLMVAILVAWYREAQLLQKSIVFVNLSSELRKIVTFSGLQSILLD